MEGFHSDFTGKGMQAERQVASIFNILKTAVHKNKVMQQASVTDRDELL